MSDTVRVCLICTRPLPRRRWWHLLAPAPLCPTERLDSCRLLLDARLHNLPPFGPDDDEGP